MAFIPLAAIWLPVSLIYSFGAELVVLREVVLALFGCVAPMAIAYGIVTNRRWSRVLIVATLGVNIWLFADGPSIAAIWSEVSSGWALSIAVLGWLAVSAYLYIAKTPRAYYLLLAGAPLPDDLKGVNLAPPRIVGRLMGYLSYFSEWVLILLALSVFFGLLLFSDRI